LHWRYPKWRIALKSNFADGLFLLKGLILEHGNHGKNLADLSLAELFVLSACGKLAPHGVFEDGARLSQREDAIVVEDFQQRCGDGPAGKSGAF
jgi:hypothetical protein